MSRIWAGWVWAGQCGQGWAGVDKSGQVWADRAWASPLLSLRQCPNPQNLPLLTLSIKPTFPDSPFLAAPARHFFLPSFAHHACREPCCLPGLHQPLGIGPLIRHMHKSRCLLKRRAVLSAIIKWCVSAEEGAIKTVWEKEGKAREGASEDLTLQLGLKGRQKMARRTVPPRAGYPGRQKGLYSGSCGSDGGTKVEGSRA